MSNERHEIFTLLSDVQLRIAALGTNGRSVLLRDPRVESPLLAFKFSNSKVSNNQNYLYHLSYINLQFHTWFLLSPQFLGWFVFSYIDLQLCWGLGFISSSDGLRSFIIQRPSPPGQPKLSTLPPHKSSSFGWDLYI